MELLLVRDTFVRLEGVEFDSASDRFVPCGVVAVTPLSALQDLLALYLAAAVVTGAVRMWRTRRTEKSENQ